MNKPACRYCGEEMDERGNDCGWFYICPKCKAQSPRCTTQGRAMTTAMRPRGCMIEIVQRGQWAENTCTVCGQSCITVGLKSGERMYIQTPYCPGCGAKMYIGKNNAIN